MERQPLGALGAHTRQLLQFLDQASQGQGKVGHGELVIGNL
jgi:hypothetical protein